MARDQAADRAKCLSGVVSITNIIKVSQGEWSENSQSRRVRVKVAMEKRVCFYLKCNG